MPPIRLAASLRCEWPPCVQPSLYGSACARTRTQTRDGVLHLSPGSAGPRRFTLPIGVGYLYLEAGGVRGELHAPPLIQARAVDLPPALLLFSLFGIGVLFGPMGVVLAAPLTVVIYVLVKHLYVHHALDDADDTVPAD